MRKILAILSFFAVFLCLPSSVAFAADADYVEGEVLVVLKADAAGGLRTSSLASVSAASYARASAVAAKIGAKALNTYPALAQTSGNVFTHMRSTTKTADQMIKELKTNPAVLSVSKNYISHAASEPNDTDYPKQWGMKKINAPAAWDTTTGSQDVVVAIIDSGVMYDHPDLAANMWHKNGVYGKMFHDNGSSDDITGEGGTKGAKLAEWSRVGDISGHGTHVAGIVGAVGNNSFGVTGVNQKVKILAVGIFSFDSTSKNTTAYDADTIAGLNYVTELKNSGENIRAANMSMEATRPVMADDSPYGLALKTASEAGNSGILFCLAAGNGVATGSGAENRDLYTDRIYPAAFRFANTLTVGGSDENDVSHFNYSTTGKWVDVAAPGVNIFSTCRTEPLEEYASGEQSVDASGYKFLNGTSMATPHVAGAAALIAAVYQDKTAAEIKELLTSTATEVCREGYTKYGQIDVAAAIKAGQKKPTSDDSGDVSESGSGSGGCNAGVGAAVLLGAAALLTAAGKKRCS